MQARYTVSPEEAGQRLDVFCVSQISQYSRAALQRAIKEGQITVGGNTVKPRYILREGNEVVVTLLSQSDQVPSQQQVMPIHLPIIYEDKDVVVVNKPAGLVVHPGKGREEQTVASWFAHRYPERIQGGAQGQWGIVHRLDKDTSGVLILAKNQSAAEYLRQQFKKRRVKKKYLALVFGVPGEAEGRITRPLARSKRNPLRRTIDPEGKPAITEWSAEEKFSGRFALLRVYPLTGRTHQIRSHLHFLGFPVVGDQLYTFKRQRPPQGVRRQLLHAEKLSLRLPTGQRKTFVASLAEDFQHVLQQLKTQNTERPKPNKTRNPKAQNI
jgi:23S rRNA pseudouridine1911/1915/1917 synthase